MFIMDVVNKLKTEFSIKDLGPLQYFVGVHVNRVSDGFFLSQQKYVANLLANVNLSNLKPESTPMEHKVNFGNDSTLMMRRQKISKECWISLVSDNNTPRHIIFCQQGCTIYDYTNDFSLETLTTHSKEYIFESFCWYYY